jgi:two-component system LytT family response regulator
MKMIPLPSLPLRTVIVDDEHHSRESLQNLLTAYCPEVEVVGMADNVETGIEAIRKYRPEVVFLDIEMPSGTGFDLLNQVGSLDFDVVFTTAFEHYALKAVKISAMDYLLKPIDVDELIDAVKKIQRKKAQEIQNKKLYALLQNLNTQGKHDHTITLATSESVEFIRVHDIIYCEANGAYTKFHLKNKHHLLVSKNLKEYEELLADYSFYRTHHSYLINVSEVKRYVKGDGGYLIMTNGDAVSISSRKKECLLQLFDNGQEVM